jgi:uncharacterized protein (TIGR03435 family)
MTNDAERRLAIGVVAAIVGISAISIYVKSKRHAEPAEDSGPRFASASVRPIPPDGSNTHTNVEKVTVATRYTIGDFYWDRGAAEYSASYASLEDLIKKAYQVNSHQLAGKPEWLGSVHFAVDAKAPDGTSGEQLWLMLQNLLADRFKLAIHREKKMVTGYRLVEAAGGAKIGRYRKQDVDAGSVHFGHDEKSFTSTIGDGTGDLSGTTTMDHLAEILSASLHCPVSNETGIGGDVEFELKWGAKQKVSGALQEQLGLTLEEQQVEEEVLRIDYVEKMPASR